MKIAAVLIALTVVATGSVACKHSDPNTNTNKNAPVPRTGLPTGRQTPEGVACDAVMAYIRSDPRAWLATLVRPMYGDKGNRDYAEFKKQMVRETENNRTNTSFTPPRLVKCYKARYFSRNGPASMAYALESFTANMFVDMVIETTPGKQQSVRYHVLRDKDDEWYFDPRPDLNPIFALGLNNESKSTEVLYEAK